MRPEQKFATEPRGRASEKRVLKEMGWEKNTKKVYSDEGAAIPDVLTESLSIEIKDCKSVACTKQLRTQIKAARAGGQKLMLVTGEKIHLTKSVIRGFHKIIRRIDLGSR